MSKFKKINFLDKIKFILKGFKKDVFFIFALLLLGMFFEMASIGIIIPAIGFLLSSNIESEFPSLIIFLNSSTTEEPTLAIFIRLNLLRCRIKYGSDWEYLLF